MDATLANLNLEGKKSMRNISFLACLLLAGCDIPALFWEEEGRKIVDDVVDEEEKLHPQQPSGKKIEKQ